MKVSGVAVAGLLTLAACRPEPPRYQVVTMTGVPIAFLVDNQKGTTWRYDFEIGAWVKIPSLEAMPTPTPEPSGAPKPPPGFVLERTRPPAARKSDWEPIYGEGKAKPKELYELVTPTPVP